MKAFDPSGPLPTGTLLLEASAGTGKTHAIAALATRYLADGVVEAEQLAVVSFSRIASAELRSRVRHRLLHSRRMIQQVLNGTWSGASDATDQVLTKGAPALLTQREINLTRALAALDSASIMTIHQFCQAMLVELGVLSDQDPAVTLVESLDDLTEEVVRDLFLARYARHPEGTPFDLTTALALGRSAVAYRTEALVPAGLSGAAGERLEFAGAVRSEVDTRKERLGLITFDDQLLRLLAALEGAGTDGLARVRARCRVVLVDEFQDTDSQQWQILQRAFDGAGPLVLIGDPKQAIYGFRGADVASYVEAVTQAADRRSLPVNHRSDAPVVTAVSGLFDGASLGQGISVLPVEAYHQGSRLQAVPGSPWRHPLRVRCVTGQDPLTAATARQRVSSDLVTQVVELLSQPPLLQTPTGPRPLNGQDIAVLVRTNRAGRRIADALTVADVPVSFTGSDSVLASHAAQEWLTLLRALEQPRRAALRAAAVLTDFVGADLADLAAASQTQQTEWAATIQQWAQALHHGGVAALFAAISQTGSTSGAGFTERVLARRRGERDLTDFRHLSELLHERHTAGVTGPALLAWLEEAVAHPVATSQRLRRLETDREAVQIMTIHRAKGLQFPVVLLPDVGDLHVVTEDDGRPIVHHEDGVRSLDLGGAAAPGRDERVRSAHAETAADQLRALYVAATRAQCQLTVWWSRTKRNTEASPLHRLLFRDRHRPGAPELAYPVDTAPGDGHPGALSWLVAAGIVVEDCPTSTPAAVLARPPRPGDPLTPLVWRRAIDSGWRRTSYSGLTAAVHARAGVPWNREVSDDEPVLPDPGLTGASSGRPSPMAELPGGAGFGSLVHQVLENLDWHTDDEATLSSRLVDATRLALARYRIPGVGVEALAEALLPSLQTPLGALSSQRALVNIPITDRLSELDFEFALGHQGRGGVLGDLARAMATYLPADDPLADYPAALAGPELADQPLRGFLTGSIDSVFRFDDGQGPRFVIVDYKTNRIGTSPILYLDDYTEPAMAREMIRSHYPLQALLYCVALHRFLRQRIRDYHPQQHLGGVGYLFVRGMGGAADLSGTGVFSWYPPAELVIAASDLLADRRRP